MKNNLIAGLVLAMLAPMIGHAAPIVWDSENYKIYADLRVDGSTSSQFNATKDILADLPFTYANTVSNATGAASADIAIRNLSDSSANIYELTNKTVTRHTGETGRAFADTSAEIINTFIANTTSLYVTYNHNASINMAASTPGKLAYQEVTTGLWWQNSNLPTVAFVDDYVDNSGTQGPHKATTDGIQYSFDGNGTHVFSGLTIGNTYQIIAAIVPDMYTSGTITDNSSNSYLKVSFSDTAPVPEPEAYAMLLAGLALVGFSARRKQQA